MLKSNILNVHFLSDFTGSKEDLFCLDTAIHRGKTLPFGDGCCLLPTLIKGTVKSLNKTTPYKNIELLWLPGAREQQKVDKAFPASLGVCLLWEEAGEQEQPGSQSSRRQNGLQARGLWELAWKLRCVSQVCVDRDQVPHFGRQAGVGAAKGSNGSS